MSDLLTALAGALSGIPELPSAACKGRADVFDLDRTSPADAVAVAKEACRACPALTACREWLTSLPAGQRPAGVVAGKLIAPPRARQQLVTAEAVEQSRPAAPTGPTALEAATTAWLADRLATGPVPSATLIAEAAVAVSAGRGVVHRAAVALGVEHRRAGRFTVWGLPGQLPAGQIDEAVWAS